MPNKRQEDLTAVRFGKLEPQDADSFIERTQAAGITANAMDWIPNRRVLRLVPPGVRLPLQVVCGTKWSVALMDCGGFLPAALPVNS